MEDELSIPLDRIILLSLCLGLAPKEQVENHVKRLAGLGMVQLYIGADGIERVRLTKSIQK